MMKMSENTRRPKKYCKKCNVHISYAGWSMHCKSEKHLEDNQECFRCSVCDATHPTPETLAKHKRRNHPELKKKIWLYKCMICDLRLRDRSHLRAHARCGRHLQQLSMSFPKLAPTDVIIKQRIVQEITTTNIPR